MKHFITYLLATLVALFIVGCGFTIMWMSGWNPGDRGEQWGAATFLTLFVATVGSVAVVGFRNIE